MAEKTMQIPVAGKCMAVDENQNSLIAGQMSPMMEDVQLLERSAHSQAHRSQQAFECLEPADSPTQRHEVFEGRGVEVLQPAEELSEGSTTQLELGSDRDALPGLVWTALPDGRLTFLNQRWSQYTGLAAEESFGRGWHAAVHPNDLPRLLSGWTASQAPSVPIEAEVRLRGADGKYRWFLFLALSSENAYGQVVKWNGISIDIDNRTRAAEALRDDATRFRDYAETASDWLFEIGPDGAFTMLTENAFDSDAAMRLGTKCWDHALDVETEAEKWSVVFAAIYDRKPFRDFVYCSVDRKGSPLYVKASGKPVFDANGEFCGYRGTGTNVTTTVRADRAEASLRQVQSELAHVGRITTLNQLAASIAHEVNQPIAAALLNAETALRCLANDQPDVERATKAIQGIIQDAQRATEIVERTRALVKNEPVRKGDVEINKAISEVIGLVSAEASRKRINLQTRFADGLPVIQGDRIQLQQVMLNLLLNGVEAMSETSCDDREIMICTEAQSESVLVAVRDSGPGLIGDVIERAFEPLYTTKSSGLGIGLTICRSIIEAHGGQLWATANVPKGAAFQFTVPVYSGLRG